MTPRAQLAFDLGLAAYGNGDLETALLRFREARESAPDWRDASFAIAQTCEKLARIDEAFEAALAAVCAGAPSADALKFFCALLENNPIPASFAPTRDALQALLAAANADLRVPARLAVAALARRPPLRDALAIARTDGFAAAAAWVLSPNGAAVLADPILRRALAVGPVTDPAIELLLSEIRRTLAFDPARLGSDPVAGFVAALAEQCVQNEHVWFAGDDETAARAGHPALDRLYPPRMPAPRIADHISDTVSRDVARQYEEHPYPPWTVVNLPAAGSVLAHVRDLQASAGLPPAPQCPRVLIAGCGTGQQVVHAAAGFGAEARIVACDLSAASLAYAARKLADYGFTGIELRQADILTLGDWRERFDVVSCVGVLHHMGDPVEGWRILTKLLAPGGVEHIALYSARARAPLAEVRRRFPPDDRLPVDARIRAFRRRVIAAHAFDWASSGLPWDDFFTLNGCRDLLFHAHETTFTIAQIAAALDALRLRFLDFVLPSSVNRAFAQAHPDPAARRDLAVWDAFERENPQAFLRMYNFWCAPKTA